MELTIASMTGQVEKTSAMLGVEVENVEIHFTPQDGKTLLSWEAYPKENDKLRMGGNVIYDDATPVEDVCTLVNRSVALYVLCLTRPDGRYIEQAMEIYSLFGGKRLTHDAIRFLAWVYADDYISLNPGLKPTALYLENALKGFIGKHIARDLPAIIQRVMEERGRKK